MRTGLICAMLLLSMGRPAGAETLYNKDGVRLSATAQAIDPGAAVCRVREERHSAEEYARLKPNDGQPLDVWRIDVLVANFSGKVLDYLSASVNVDSDWPLCDHWDGPEASYGEPVTTEPLMSIQRAAGVKPGEEVRETAFVLAYHDQEPSIGRWDIDYDLAPRAATATTAPGAERPAAAGGAPDPGTPGQGAPDPTCAGKEIGAECWMETENQSGCYLWNPNLQRGETVTWTGNCADGLANGAGEGIWNYKAAKRVDKGPYVDGKKNGHWIIRWTDGRVDEGPYVDGKRNGRWTQRTGDGSVEEGPYVDGEKNGRWTQRTGDGLLCTKSWVNGEYQSINCSER